MKYLFVIFFSLTIGFKAFACGGAGVFVYSAERTDSIDASNPLQVNLTVMMDFDRIDTPRANDSIYVNWGDGNVTTIYASNVKVDTQASANIGTLTIYLHTYQGSHIY